MRDRTPVRRASPTENPVGNNWGQHKADLKQDFNDHCGYCHSYDGFRHTYFEVDHFVPKKFFSQFQNITLTQYSNLIYSCKFCNNNKSSKWPSNSETVYHVNDEGFVDPCTDDYAGHFKRNPDGGLMWTTNLGKWMFEKGFKFGERYDSIKLLYNLNQLRLTIDVLITVLNKHPKGSKEYDAIFSKASGYTFEYYQYHQELIKFYG